MEKRKKIIRRKRPIKEQEKQPDPLNRTKQVISIALGVVSSIAAIFTVALDLFGNRKTSNQTQSAYGVDQLFIIGAAFAIISVIVSFLQYFYTKSKNK